MFKKNNKMPPGANIPSMISEITEVIGDIKSQGLIRYDGLLTGNVIADHVILGASSYINGRVIANELTVFGNVNGEIHAKFVSLMKTSDVKGTICKNTISIEAGARYSGQTMDLDLEQLKAIPSHEEDVRMISYQEDKELEIFKEAENDNEKEES